MTREVLEQVEKAEESMRALGFRELRVRHHGELARVEIARNELPRALSMEMLDAITVALEAGRLPICDAGLHRIPVRFSECDSARRTYWHGAAHSAAV